MVKWALRFASASCLLFIVMFMSGCITAKRESLKDPVAMAAPADGGADESHENKSLLFGSSEASSDDEDLGEERRLDVPVVDLNDEKSGEEEAADARSGRSGDLLFKAQQQPIWPLEHGRVTSSFGWRRKRHFHAGIDIVAPRGSRVSAVLDGTVIFAGRKPGYGRMIVLEHASGRTGYAHLAEILVKKGEDVKKGELIGRVGASGRATGPHLHFEFRTLDDEPMDPLRFLPQEHLFSLR